MKYIVSYLENGERLDKAISLLNKDLSRSFITKLLKDGKITVNGQVEKPSYKVKENDEIILEEIVDVKADIKEEDIPLDVVYEDDDILIINTKVPQSSKSRLLWWWIISLKLMVILIMT